MPIRVCVAGVTGWTGSAVAQAVDAADDLELVAGVSRFDPASRPVRRGNAARDPCSAGAR